MTHIDVYGTVFNKLSPLTSGGYGMSLAEQNTGRKWTYADYCTWPDDERWEIIDGVAYNMSPAPSQSHQLIAGNLFRQIAVHLHGKPCKTFFSPFDVRFTDNLNQSDNYIDTVVQPDILVVCDSAKLDDRGCKGSPDLVIEISSPSTGTSDLTIKFDLYQRFGVKEYWIVHPDEQTVMVFKLQENGLYGAPDRYGSVGLIDVPLLGELSIDLDDIFTK
jgi:Uma2 family endonuclease